jgi:ATP-dependent Clp protease ATP-binding subunit ClpA
MKQIYSSNGDIDKIVKAAREYAKQLNHEYFQVEHLLHSLMHERNFNALLEELGIQTETLIDEIEAYLEAVPFLANEELQDDPKKTASLERVFNRAFTQVIFSGRQQISLIDLYLSITNETHSHAAYFLNKYGVEKETVVKAWTKNRKAGKNTKNYAEKTLEQYCTNLMTLAGEGKMDPVIGRSEEIAEMEQILARKSKCNVLLVGDAGVGKTAIVDGLVLDIIEERIPEFLNGWVVYSLNIGSLLAGTKYRGEFEERLQEILAAAQEMKKVILFIDEAHQMRGAGGGNNSAVDLANMIKPALARGDIKVIAATTWEEYTQHFEKDRALMRRFNRLTVDEPTPEVAKQILEGIRDAYESFHEVEITDDAIQSAVDLSVRFQNDKKLPDKAIDLIDSACALKRSTDAEDRTINEFSIQREISRITGVPIAAMQEQEDSFDITTVETDIKTRVYGQDDAVTQILDRVWVNRAGLKSSNRPVGSFLLLGPTGTGKTELAKSLAERLSMKFLRFDMSEYGERHAVSRLIGAPPGYVGYEDANLAGGMLISEVSKNPHAVILFDEVEKAHPEVTQILLQIMDDGFVTGSNGKKADCRQAIILLTSNLGAADNERNNIGFGSLVRTGEDDKAVKEFFRPEFRNRLDAVIKFNKLNKETIKKVAEKFVNEVSLQLQDKNMLLELDEAAWEYLVEHGYDAAMGARPMARLIHEEIKVPLARKILFDKITSRATIRVSATGDKLELSVDQEQEVLHQAISGFDGLALSIS